jgi:hypothetical protein
MVKKIGLEYTDYFFDIRLEKIEGNTSWVLDKS